MPTLSWNEIQSRAVEFASKWKGETYEKGESQSFWSDFLNVYGIDRKRIGAFFEYAIKKVDNKQGFIDMFWPGMLLAEQKSGGRDLGKAGVQAFEYLQNMPDHDLPQKIVLSDFTNFKVIDPATNERSSFTLETFPKHVKEFGFLIVRESEKLAEEDPVNRRAAEAMAALHNELRDSNFTGHELELLLVRLVFCLFADDSGIFEQSIFEKYLTNRTSEDGSDVGPRLGKIFETLNTPEDQRQTTLDEDIATFPYINGGLFKEITRMPDFTSAMRDKLLGATNLDWSSVSPAIFGSMFQGVMDEKMRRNLGAHYTSEKNIFKVIDSLFLDDLKEEFEKVKRSKLKLAEFHNKLANLKFLDPACGCGNFLVITYRELRRLEHLVLEAIHGKQALLTDLADNIKVNVDQMYGIEIEEFPSLIAETALWLTDHQMNMEASKQFGQHFVRLPLTTTPNIVNDNALSIDWAEIINPKELNYILGNPPFTGSNLITVEMRKDLEMVFAEVKSAGLLDYVSAWYIKATELMSINNQVRSALVSTNSITQGEQVGILWKYLFAKGIEINFAHRTFKWTNDASGVAAVFCVIIGFSYQQSKRCLFDYENPKSEAHVITAQTINPYLIDAPVVFLERRTKPICDVPKIRKGNQPTDGGNLILSEEEYQGLKASDPAAVQFIKKLIGAKEFLHNYNRYCIWLPNASPSELKKHTFILDRIERCKVWRLNEGKAADTIALASTPGLFRETNNPETFVVVPSVSSERREYIPFGFRGGDTIATNLCLIIPDATKFHFGILSSQMHMAWVKYTCGRLESRYRYSKDIVYNNFPWPQNVSEEQNALVESLSQKILDARSEFPDSSLADLYDPRTMPPSLSKAHRALDKYVDSLYQSTLFKDDSERIAYLFERYSQLSE